MTEHPTHGDERTGAFNTLFSTAFTTPQFNAVWANPLNAADVAAWQAPTVVLRATWDLMARVVVTNRIIAGDCEGEGVHRA